MNTLNLVVSKLKASMAMVMVGKKEKVMVMCRFKTHNWSQIRIIIKRR